VIYWIETVKEYGGIGMKRLLLITIFLVVFLCSCSNKHCEHEIVIDEAVETTCTSSGLSEGSHCSKCGEIIQEQVSIPALGHTTDAGTCKRCGTSFGIWKIEHYVNEFNEETYREYITTDKKLEGTFNNSAATDSMLKADILVDSLGVSIVLYEYGDRQVKSSLSTDYQISVKYGSKTESVSGELSNDRIKIYGDSKNESIICALASGKTVKFYIEETKHPITNYSFTVESSNFKDRYTEAIGLLEDENTATYMPPTTPAEILTEEELKYREAADLARKFDYESAYNTLLEIQDYKNVSDLLPLLENPLYGVYQCEDSSSYIYLWVRTNYLFEYTSSYLTAIEWREYPTIDKHSDPRSMKQDTTDSDKIIMNYDYKWNISNDRDTIYQVEIDLNGEEKGEFYRYTYSRLSSEDEAAAISRVKDYLK